MNDQNGFDNNGVYHFNYSAQPSDPWEQPQQSPAAPPQPPRKKKKEATRNAPRKKSSASKPPGDRPNREASAKIRNPRDYLVFSHIPI